MSVSAEILRELVRIPTPSSASNLPLLEWVQSFVEARGWRTAYFPYTDANGVSKANLIARPEGFAGEDETISLAYLCHTDTVPPAGHWEKALDLTSEDGKTLRGLGVADAKGSLACFLAAMDQSAAQAAHADVALILTADQETGSLGLEKLLSGTHLKIGSAIVGAPTSLRPAIAGKGYGLARVTVKSRAAHSAYPAEGISAIALAARFITRVEGLLQQFSANAEAPLAANLLFDPPATTVNVGVIEGGSANNILAGECSLMVEWRPVPSDPPRAVLTELQWLADILHVEEPQARIHVELLRAEPGFARASSGPLLKKLQELCAQLRRPMRAPTGISFHTEAARLNPVAGEVLVIGPGEMRTAHSERECVLESELEEWSAMLSRLIAAHQGAAALQQS